MVDLSINDGNGPSERNLEEGTRYTRRAFGGLMFGGFVGIGRMDVARGEALF